MANTMSNEDYVESLGIEDDLGKKSMLKAMEKYGDNKWWLSNDLKVVGYYQFHEPCLLVNLSHFGKGLESLLGYRPKPIELVTGYLNQEIETTWGKYATKHKPQITGKREKENDREK